MATYSITQDGKIEIDYLCGRKLSRGIQTGLSSHPMKLLPKWRVLKDGRFLIMTYSYLSLYALTLLTAVGGLSKQ